MRGYGRTVHVQTRISLVAFEFGHVCIVWTFIFGMYNVRMMMMMTIITIKRETKATMLIEDR